MANHAVINLEFDSRITSYVQILRTKIIKSYPQLTHETRFRQTNRPHEDQLGDSPGEVSQGPSEGKTRFLSSRSIKFTPLRVGGKD